MEQYVVEVDGALELVPVLHPGARAARVFEQKSCILIDTDRCVDR